MRATVVILTKLPGALPVKTRLHPLLGAAGATAFYVDSLRRAVELARGFDPAPRLAYSPADADAIAALPGFCGLVPVHGGDGAACLEQALLDAYGGVPLLALGGDAPDLPPARVEAALAALAQHDAAFVPTGDGGFSCLALREPAPGLAAGFTFGGDNALGALTAWLRSRGRSVAHVAPWPDVDTPDDYRAWIARRRNSEATRSQGGGRIGGAPLIGAGGPGAA